MIGPSPPAFALGFASGVCATLGLIVLAGALLWLLYRTAVRRALGG